MEQVSWWQDKFFHDFSAEDVIEKLWPRLTRERQQKFDRALRSRTFKITPIMENIYDRGNISAAMRSAEAFGFIDFRIIEPPDSRFKTANRVTQGTEKWLHVRKYPSPKPLIQELQQKDVQVYATHLDSETSINDLDFTRPTAVIFGNEKEGVSKDTLRQVNGTFKIPMQGFAQSFNISVAAALAFYHIYWTRSEKLGASGDLNYSEKTNVLANYLVRSIPNAAAYFS